MLMPDLRAGDVGTIRVTTGLARSLTFTDLASVIDSGSWTATADGADLSVTVVGDDVKVAVPGDVATGAFELLSAGEPQIVGYISVTSHGTSTPDASVQVVLRDQQVTTMVVAGPAGPKGDQGEQGEQGDPGTTDYNELLNKPTLGTAAGQNVTAFDSAGTATAAVAAHSADTTAVHGIADTSALVLTDDSRLTDARTPTGHAASHTDAGSDALTLAQSQIVGLVAALAAKATPADITTAVNALVAGSPGLLDTLKEIADALGDDPNFAATMTTALAGKQPLATTLTMLAGLSPTSTGTSILTAANAAAVRTILSLGTAALSATGDFDASGAAAAAQAAAVQRANHTGTQAQSTITGLVAALALLAPLASPTFTGVATAPVLSASGLTGAVAASRHVGGTASGAPASGTFAVGDFVIDQGGIVWVCTSAGSPGTWVDASSTGRELASASSIVNQTGIAGTATDITNLTVTFTVGSRPVWVEALLPFVFINGASTSAYCQITDNSGVVKARAALNTPSMGAPVIIRERISTPGSTTRKVQIIRAAGAGTINNNIAADTTVISTLSAIER